VIKSVQFHNFKVLRDATLPLSRFTLIVGPNGSGKSTALQAFQAAGNPGLVNFASAASFGFQANETRYVEITVRWGGPHEGKITRTRWMPRGYEPPVPMDAKGTRLPGPEADYCTRTLAGIKIYSFDAQAICVPAPVIPTIELARNGTYLAGIIDQLRDRDPERFEELNDELGRWLPEFDRILLNVPSSGHKTLRLRTREGRYLIEATDLSQGTLLALAFLTLAYIPDPPPIVCFEDPDRGIHPRLLRDVRDAIYRLSYPENFNEKRPPVQVLATTHSPYFLDLFRDHPEEVVIAHRVRQEARFDRLSERSDIEDILGNSHLGEAWYSGILGGIPSER